MQTKGYTQPILSKVPLNNLGGEMPNDENQGDHPFGMKVRKIGKQKGLKFSSPYVTKNSTI